MVVLVHARRTAGALNQPSLVRQVMDSTLLIVLVVLLVLFGGGWGYSRRRR